MTGRDLNPPPKGDITQCARVWRDTRVWIQPLRITLENYERTGKSYVYAKKRKNPYSNENKKIVRDAKATCVNTRVHKNYKLSTQRRNNPNIVKKNKNSKV